MTSTSVNAISAEELAAFSRDGFLLKRSILPTDVREKFEALVLGYETAVLDPIEFEADTGYPGAPTDRKDAGGDAIRRLLQIYDRHPIFREWARSPQLTARIRVLLGVRPGDPAGGPVFVRAHHNCVMIKDTRHSSDTMWHQDIRYWSYGDGNLVSAMTALSPADEKNGCLRVIPGSHARDYPAERFDERVFFRDDLPANETEIATAVEVPMRTGDVLFFHAKLLHAAGRNRSVQKRVSLIYTYRRGDNPPLPGSRSASLDDVVI